MSIGPDGGFEMDFLEFMRGLDLYDEKVQVAAELGMFEALSALKDDCDNITPVTPFKDGNLRGNYTFILEGITQSKIQEVGSKNRGGGKPAERRGAVDIVAKLIFRMPYAAKWHEAVSRAINWTLTRISRGTPGAKWVESKLINGKKYFQLVALRIKEATGG
jgi:hypothetical protein